VPRPLPLLGDQFEVGCRTLRNFARRLEANHAQLKTPNAGLTLSGIELNYELIYLKVFLLWESFLQEVFVRLLMGFESNGGIEQLQAGVPHSRSLADAETLLLAGRQFRLWHDPVQIMMRSDHYFVPAGSHFRSVIGANQASLTDFAKVRHQIAHSQAHARAEFDAATMSMAGKRYAGHAGRFLRDTRPDGRRWLEFICDELAEVAHQIS
jgi:hypothetical protein